MSDPRCSTIQCLIAELCSPWSAASISARFIVTSLFRRHSISVSRGSIPVMVVLVPCLPFPILSFPLGFSERNPANEILFLIAGHFTRNEPRFGFLHCHSWFYGHTFAEPEGGLLILPSQTAKTWAGYGLVLLYVCHPPAETFRTRICTDRGIERHSAYELCFVFSLTNGPQQLAV